ncbi:MAG TPA: MXAN_5187 C-terminal domain-containing protein [Myxococcota bacterium]|nr:MXAN_5187 C-terminal domain-containing protein [Myxococcota bacterium]
MSRAKAVIVVILIVGASGAGAVYGLNQFYQKQVQARIESQLAGVDLEILDLLRVRAFESIQKLSFHSRDPKLSLAVGKIDPVAADTPREELSQLLKDANSKLLPVLTEIRKMRKLDRVLALSKDGLVVASVPDGTKFGDRLKGLPAVAECLTGVSRDGLYELSGKVLQVAVVPILSASGSISGCLMSTGEIDSTSLGRLVHHSGLQAVLFAGDKIMATTIEGKAAPSLVSDLDKKEIVRFGQLEKVPLLSGLKDAYAAKIVSIPGGTDPLHLAIALPLAGLVEPLAKAQKTIFMALAALLILGILISLLLSGSKTAKDLSRLLDGVKLMAEGSSTSLNADSFSGTMAELARDIQQFATNGSKQAGVHADSSMFLSGALSGKVEAPPETPAGKPSAPVSSLDFESLLGGAMESAPPDTGRESQPPASVPVVPPPAVTASPSGRPAGPRVELPGELAGMFDGQEDTREVEPFVPDMARPDVSRPPPVRAVEKHAFVAPEIPPAPAPMFDSGAMVFETPPDLDTGLDEQITSSDYRPDATVIAQVPSELLNLAQGGESDLESAAASIPPPPSPPSILPRPPVSQRPAPAADAHFKDVFDQFVVTKKQCGEPTTGLTYDRFSEKLRKNTNDLKTRYKCRSVKFQVYVKNGKAALRATPIK